MSDGMTVEGPARTAGGFEGGGGGGWEGWLGVARNGIGGAFDPTD